MPSKELRILFVSDVVGRAGRRVLFQVLPSLRRDKGVQLCVANGENAAGGFGITVNIVRKLYSYGVDVITSGNHIWDKKEILDYIGKDERLLRPANYPSQAPGRGSGIYETEEGVRVGVLNLQGRVFLPSIDCPFRIASQVLKELRGETRVIIVDMHAEATSEKIAMGWYLDGMVSAVIGTHTHVQTADETILPKGTAYITDVGMCGAYDSVIGMDKSIVLSRLTTQIPYRFIPAKKDLRFSGLLLDVDVRTGEAKRVERIRINLEAE